MLKDMDKRLAADIDSIIAQYKQGCFDLFKGDQVDFKKTWLGDLHMIGQEYSCLADPQAYEIGIRLIQLIESKFNAVATDDSLTEKNRGDIQFEISSRRRQLGLDQRINEIRRARKNNQDSSEW